MRRTVVRTLVGLCLLIETSEPLRAEEREELFAPFVQETPVWESSSVGFARAPVSAEAPIPAEAIDLAQPVVQEALAERRARQSCEPFDWSALEVSFLARGYFVNDQRIEFTGQEDTFGVEGVFDMGWSKDLAGGVATAHTQLFLNQPFDDNVLVDTPFRESYAHNFEVEPLEISQLYLRYETGDWNFVLGKFMTPFGRVWFPIYTNDFRDSPFIRSEAILWRETGVMVERRLGEVSLTAAITNGSLERDTNSSKALVSRVGWNRDERWNVGASIKMQDGIGSEGQKEFNEHVGFDAMTRLGSRWILSGELIFDRYGIRRPGFPLDDIFWGRSYYNRQLNAGYHEALSGVGYYADLGYLGDLWSLHFNYGEFRPDPVGDRLHDTNNHRGMAKTIRHVAPGLDVYSIVLVENRLFDPDMANYRKGFSIWAGVQWAW
ncbi:MAG TPA: hypothetical protein VGN57_03715 [Pirellulaceae bacterium]|nr:hypothetical protein [Pirellulaceae bacterium]